MGYLTLFLLQLWLNVFQRRLAHGLKVVLLQGSSHSLVRADVILEIYFRDHLGGLVSWLLLLFGLLLVIGCFCQDWLLAFMFCLLWVWLDQSLHLFLNRLKLHGVVESMNLLVPNHAALKVVLYLYVGLGFEDRRSFTCGAEIAGLVDIAVGVFFFFRNWHRVFYLIWFWDRDFVFLNRWDRVFFVGHAADGWNHILLADHPLLMGSEVTDEHHWWIELPVWPGFVKYSHHVFELLVEPIHELGNLLVILFLLKL